MYLKGLQMCKVVRGIIDVFKEMYCRGQDVVLVGMRLRIYDKYKFMGFIIYVIKYNNYKFNKMCS